jgi:hypothetical protein
MVIRGSDHLKQISPASNTNILPLNHVIQSKCTFSAAQEGSRNLRNDVPKKASNKPYQFWYRTYRTVLFHTNNIGNAIGHSLN